MYPRCSCIAIGLSAAANNHEPQRPVSDARAVNERSRRPKRRLDWTPYLGDAFLAFNLRMSIPALAQPEELVRFRAPTLVLGAGRDLSFPGEPLVARATQLFPAHAETELVADSRHCPPTTDEFRRWLGARISGFLDPN